MAALVVNILWQVTSRFALNDPSSYTEEIARFLLIWIGLLGGCYAYRHNSHLGLDLLTQKLSPAAQRLAALLIDTVTIAFAALVLGYGGGQLVWLTLELQQTSAALGIPMGYVYSVLPLSGALMVFYCLALRDRTRAPEQGS
ncbi:TRAP transporter small permease [Mangrovimicrobium sediminis]|uniref:TRAP transporter small permease protein n=2 Tax=Mangrovimicrobium sediminis TaxID=2562682 RepID=A0A4Z0LX89_9GAMM|nr:TRAP transporter small permease [Haliea sp. SAOS-164]